ncbi:hypothetical protein D0B54_02545 [Solimonas sp. K1W22B-7]|nr:hypothetical protein D0B54_02545 [Solimonas sp. K1W22B-7]
MKRSVGRGLWLTICFGLGNLVTNIIKHWQAIGLSGTHEAANDLYLFKVVTDLLFFRFAKCIWAVQKASICVVELRLSMTKSLKILSDFESAMKAKNKSNMRCNSSQKPL